MNSRAALCATATQLQSRLGHTMQPSFDGSSLGKEVGQVSAEGIPAHPEGQRQEQDAQNRIPRPRPQLP